MLINIQNVCFPKEYKILPIKKKRSLIFCADRIDVIANFAVVTNAVIKKVHYKMTILVHESQPRHFVEFANTPTKHD